MNFNKTEDKEIKHTFDFLDLRLFINEENKKVYSVSDGYITLMRGYEDPILGPYKAASKIIRVEVMTYEAKEKTKLVK